MEFKAAEPASRFQILRILPTGATSSGQPMAAEPVFLAPFQEARTEAACFGS
jgi:hypothetical protein